MLVWGTAWEDLRVLSAFQHPVSVLYTESDYALNAGTLVSLGVSNLLFPSGGLGDGVHWSTACPVTHVDGPP